MNGWACGAGVGAIGGVGVDASMEAAPGTETIGDADADGFAEVGGVAGGVAVGVVAATEASAPLVETGVPPKAVGEAAAIGVVGASVPDDDAGKVVTAAAAVGAVPPVAVCAAAVDMDG